MGIIGIINTLFLEVSEIVFKGVCRNLVRFYFNTLPHTMNFYCIIGAFTIIQVDIHINDK